MTARAADGVLLPPTPLGVIGGGQLGRMFLQAAQRLGYRTVVLSAGADSPAAQIAHEVIIGLPDNLTALGQFARRVRAATVEFENVSAPALRWLQRRGVIVRPGWRSIWVSQNRRREKSFLQGEGLPLAPWRPVRTQDELMALPAALGLPLILKTAGSGYDGKGQCRVERAADLDAAWSALNRVACVAESVISFASEVSVIAVRGHDGTTLTYPVFENRHARHILDTTVCPASLAAGPADRARALAGRVVARLGTVGVLTVEFFVLPDETLLINELAPRPHNSGHLTIEAAVTSQFEQQARALAGLPLGPTDLIQPAAMANLLGDLWSGGTPDWPAVLGHDSGVHLHLYGKDTAAAGRKMGHVTVVDSSPERARARVEAARRKAARGT